MLLESHVAGDVDELIVTLEDTTALVRKVGRFTLEYVEELAVGHSTKVELVPEDHRVDVVLKVREPVVDPEAIDCDPFPNLPG